MLSWVAWPVHGISSAVDRRNGGAKKYLSPNGLDLDDKVIGTRVHSIWVGHGFLAAIGSVVSGPLAGSAITHWWVEIETEYGYYCAQFDGNDKLTLTKHHSVKEVYERSKLAVGCGGANKSISNRYTYKPAKNVQFMGKIYNEEYHTMKDIVNFMKQYNGTYDLVLNNSQHFGKSLHDWLYAESARSLRHWHGGVYDASPKKVFYEIHLTQKLYEERLWDAWQEGKIYWFEYMTAKTATMCARITNEKNIDKKVLQVVQGFRPTDDLYSLGARSCVDELDYLEQKLRDLSLLL